MTDLLQTKEERPQISPLRYASVEMTDLLQTREERPQISPLRYASVEMTDLLQTREERPQISPLRYASVEMTDLLQTRDLRFLLSRVVPMHHRQTWRGGAEVGNPATLQRTDIDRLQIGASESDTRHPGGNALAGVE
jgi:hypothetical protein